MESTLHTLHTLHTLQNIIDDNKEKISSDEYLKICEKMKLLSIEMDHDFYKVTYVEIEPILTGFNSLQTFFKTYTKIERLSAGDFIEVTQDIERRGYFNKIPVHSMPICLYNKKFLNREGDDDDDDEEDFKFELSIVNTRRITKIEKCSPRA
jgi:hypothetical protein